jgi:hypothetical protein
MYESSQVLVITSIAAILYLIPRGVRFGLGNRPASAANMNKLEIMQKSRMFTDLLVISQAQYWSHNSKRTLPTWNFGHGDNGSEQNVGSVQAVPVS